MTETEKRLFKQWEHKERQGEEVTQHIRDFAEEWEIDPGLMLWAIVHYFKCHHTVEDEDSGFYSYMLGFIDPYPYNE